MTLTAIDANEEETDISFIWRDNASVQRLLDVIVLILVKEYVQAVKKNPSNFQVAINNKSN